MNENIIKKWWDQNPQGYGDDLLSKHKKIDFSSKKFSEFIENNDKNFINAAYFAQLNSDEPFELLLPSDSKNKVVLEIGSGLGFHAELLSKKFKKVITIDLTEYSVAITKKRMQLKNIENVDVICCSATEIPLEDQSVDFVWSWGVLHHIPDINMAISEIERILKLNGEFWGMFYNKNSIYNWLNVYLRYGIFKFEIFKYSQIELTSKYSDGKSFGGNPYTKFYSISDLNKLFKNFKLIRNHCYENKNIFLFIFNHKLKEYISKFIPNKLMIKLFRYVGFLNYVRYQKK